jgi:iron complex transport system substrate-binding protein
MMRATNIADSWYTETGATRVDINLETVFAGQPSMILVQCHSDTDSVTSLMNEQYGDNAVWKAIPAVKNDQIFFLEKALFHNKPNSRFAEAYQKLAQILYPDVQFSFMSDENNV